MKTIKDLFELILAEEMLNEKHIMQYTFDINTRYMWLSMDVYITAYEIDENGREERVLKLYNNVVRNASIKTPAELQQVYWTIYNNGRSASQA